MYCIFSQPTNSQCFRKVSSACFEQIDDLKIAVVGLMAKIQYACDSEGAHFCINVYYIENELYCYFSKF